MLKYLTNRWSFTTGWNRIQPTSLCFCFILLFLAVSAKARASRPVEVLKQELLTVSNDSVRASVLLALGRRYNKENSDSSLTYLFRSLTYAGRCPDSRLKTAVLYELGLAYLYTVKDEAKALQWTNQARLLAQRHNDHSTLARCYQLLSIIAFHQHTGNAQSLLATALVHARQANQWEVLSEVYSLRADFYRLKKQYAPAERDYWRAIQMLEGHSPDQWLTAALDYCAMLEAQGKTAQARAYARKLFKARFRLRQAEGSFVYTNDLARLCLLLKKYALAERYLREGLTRETRGSRPDSLHLYFYTKTLEDLYVRQSLYKKAYHYGKELSELRLWLQRKRQTRDVKVRMAELKAALSVERKDRQVAELQARQHRQQGYFLALLFFALLLSAFVLVLQRKQRHIRLQHAELARLNATKDKLFSMLAHDLRSPFISLANRLNVTPWSDSSPQELAEILPELARQMKVLQTGLDNLLNWAQSQMGGLAPFRRPVNVGTLVHSQIEMLRGLAEAKSIQVTAEVSPAAEVLADADHLAMIVRNLLHNAIKFSWPGGRVAITCRQEGQEYCMQVTDTGIGLAPEALPTLFSASALSSKRGTLNESGAGIGLLLVGELVGANQGRIAVSSSLGKGSTFSLYLPKG